MSSALYYPQGVAVDSAGNVYIADTDNNTIDKVLTDTIVGDGGAVGGGDGGW